MTASAVVRSRDSWLGGRVWRGSRWRGEGRASRDGALLGACGRPVRAPDQAQRQPPAARCEGRVLRRGPARGPRTGLTLVGQRRLRRHVVTALTLVGNGRTLRAKVKVVKPDVTTEQARRQVPAGHNRRPACSSSSGSSRPEAEEDLQDRRRPGWSGDTCRSLPRAEQGEPGLARSEQRLGGKLAGR